LAAFRQSLAPLRHTLQAQDFLGGEEPSYADYAVFGSFQWARCVSPQDVLAEDDSLRSWRSAMLELFDGLAERALAA
jgi:glutathione S-transferase